MRSEENAALLKAIETAEMEDRIEALERLAGERNLLSNGNELMDNARTRDSAPPHHRTALGFR